ncbi:tubulin-like doman-containing protein [Streptomyces sp. NRRL S-340]|uniref:tubulin-like doman-containing protein n=1 Tax=Streptomyces sp. NRRL S-340 TaxID=1463901 RepID=UPI00056D319F|nr:tubulin-like doman-containing protein [Streptomyces sp. NRRL S-340]
MKIFQPMLFVGLGGTGGLVGAELERRLRVELCGPDGMALSRMNGHAPFQLPDCLQFVYADYSESDLQRLPQFNVDPSLRAAYARTSRATHNLLPNFDSSPEVTKMLRASLREEVAGWLPPITGEPEVTPLHNGAGQLPTVGRAALFATLRHSLAPVLEPLLQAIDAIAKSAGELSELGGGKVNGCDVFVAFSVAGGTGAGIFLDYLHLINHAFRLRSFDGVKIYPLVVMPSSFSAATGGGREAELNAARALVDLFRLVDQQNAPVERPDIGDLDHEAKFGIRYPGITPVRLRTGILPTAFLFSPTAGIRADDLRRSIVSLVMSLVGTELGDGRPQGRKMAADDDYQTFAASFINRGVARSSISPTGIGRRGVSTSLVASMTAPMDQLADLVAGRMLREAVTDLVERPRAELREGAVPMIRQLFADSHLEELWERRQLAVPEPDPLPRGGRNIEQALGQRITDMQALLSDLRAEASRQAAVMADRFAPRPAIDKLLQSADPFLVERVVRGVPDSEEQIARLGFLGMLDSRARAPQRPPGVTEQPPKIPRIKGQLAGLAPARWGDDDVQAALQEQNTWYQWRCRSIWHEAWREQQQHWQPQADVAGIDLDRLVRAFLGHSDQERKASQQKGRELYEDRTGISYLLPPQRTLNHFYEDVVARLRHRENLREQDHVSALLLKLIDGDAWRQVHTLSRRDPEGAVARIKSQLEGRITRLFAESGTHLEERPLLPAMGTLLAAAAGDADARDQVSKDALDVFGRKLAGLLPVGFTPEGTGPLRVLVTYPRVQAVDEVQEFLGKTLRLPSDAKNSVEYRGVESDSVTVVLFRSEMSLTQVPEARKVLRQWARAKENEQAQDVLRWRQRLGFRDTWMVSTEDDRQTILHRLLCCLWNGQVDVLDGGTDSPRRIRLRLFPDTSPDVPGVRLRLGDFPDGVSSWAELLRSYERWTVLDDEATVEDYCYELMAAQPLGLSRTGSTPHPLFVELVEEIAPRQLELLQERRERGGRRVEGWVRPLWEFWAETLPAALDKEFGDQRAVQPTLRTLLEHVRGGSPARPREEASAPRRPAPEDDDFGTTPFTGRGSYERENGREERDERNEREQRYERNEREPRYERRTRSEWDDRDERGVWDEAADEYGTGRNGRASGDYRDARDAHGTRDPRDPRGGDAWRGRREDRYDGDGPRDDRGGEDGGREDRFGGGRYGDRDRAHEDDRERPYAGDRDRDPANDRERDRDRRSQWRDGERRRSEGRPSFDKPDADARDADDRREDPRREDPRREDRGEGDRARRADRPRAPWDEPGDPGPYPGAGDGGRDQHRDTPWDGDAQ